jgi:hypothetical protein
MEALNFFELTSETWHLNVVIADYFFPPICAKIIVIILNIYIYCNSLIGLCLGAMKEIVSNESVQINPLKSFLRAGLVNISTYILYAKRHENCKNLELL